MSRKREPQAQVIVPPAFSLSKSPEYKIVFASGVFGGINPNDAQMIFYLDRFEPELVPDQPGTQRLSKINREFQVEIHVTPSQFKSIAQWMTQHVQNYEKNFGEIPLGPREAEEKSPPSGIIS
jgi:hypothetical protein